MATYVSKFTGVEIDRAVAYFNDIQRTGRKVITFDTSSNDWKTSSDDGDKTNGNYYIDASLSGVGSIDGGFSQPPQVFFIQGDVYGDNIGQVGLRWDLDYKWDIGSNASQHIRAYSNIPIIGKLCLVTVLSDISGDSSTDSDVYVNENLTVRGNISQSGISAQENS